MSLDNGIYIVISSNIYVNRLARMKSYPMHNGNGPVQHAIRSIVSNATVTRMMVLVQTINDGKKKMAKRMKSLTNSSKLEY